MSNPRQKMLSNLNQVEQSEPACYIETSNPKKEKIVPQLPAQFVDVRVSPAAQTQHKNVVMFPRYRDVKIHDAAGHLIHDGDCVLANVAGVVVITEAEYTELEALRTQARCAPKF